MNLPTVRLGDVADVNWGDTSVTKASYVEKGFPAYSATGCDGYLPYADYNHPAIVLSAIGARCGKTWYATGSWSCIKNTIRFWSTSNQLDNRYLYWVTFDEEFWPRRGAAQPFITIGDARDLRIPLPSMEEQRRIADILDKADALRAKRREAVAQLDRFSQSIFVEMFGDPVTNPKSWPICQLESIVAKDDSINYGVIQPGDDMDAGVPLIRVGDLQEGCVSHCALKKIDPKIENAYLRSRLKGDEILVSCVGSIGVVALTSESERGFNIARAVARIRVAKSVEREFVAEHLRTASVQNYFRRELRTVSQPTLNIKQIAETMVMVPPKHLQNEFVQRVSAVKALRSAHLQAAENTTKLFAALQRKAFQGAI